MMNTDPLRAGARQMTQWLRGLKPPIHQAQFWFVQAGVLTLAVLHDVVLVDLHVHQIGFGMPAPITSGLLLIPVIYAALNFGVRGAVGTALWATALIVPHWLLDAPFTSTHFWIEFGFLLVVNAVAIVVGQRVEREQQARQRAEAALRAAKVAEARYYSLFEDQPAPVLITDMDGVVSELNSAASRLFGPVTGRPLGELVGATIDGLLKGEPPCLSLQARHGEQLLFAPTANRLVADDTSSLIQVVLTDVTEQHHRQAEQRMFASRLLTVQEEERRRLARELHDDPLQNLTYLTRDLDDLSNHPQIPDDVSAHLGRNGAVAAEAASALRKLIHGLRPPVLDDLGLVSALRQMVEEARQRTGLAVDFKVTGTQVRLRPELELAAYRIAQESLNNVIRHANASRANVRLRFGAKLTLTVMDDGQGMPPAGNGHAESESAFGLIGMRERVSMAGGALKIGPSAPGGTLVRATIPYDHLTRTDASPAQRVAGASV